MSSTKTCIDWVIAQGPVNDTSSTVIPGHLTSNTSKQNEYLLFAKNDLPQTVIRKAYSHNMQNMWCMLCVTSKGARNNTSSDVMSGPFGNTVSNEIHNDVVPTSAHDSVGWFLGHEVRSQKYQLLILWFLLVAMACSCAWLWGDPGLPVIQVVLNPFASLSRLTSVPQSVWSAHQRRRKTTVKLMVYNYWQCLVMRLLRLLHINF